mmetsp:Transcript_29628/g.62919  ORF Transcript_29628/g.62919 Transcript_29628/m.62919 type:complete len:949 (+) Transcript_29628:112-2958(+)
MDSPAANVNVDGKAPTDDVSVEDSTVTNKNVDAVVEAETSANIAFDRSVTGTKAAISKPLKKVFPKQNGNAWAKPAPQVGFEASESNHKKRSNVHFSEDPTTIIPINNEKDDTNAPNKDQPFVSLADIMVEQELEKAKNTKNFRVSFAQGIETEEERQMRIAIEASLRDQLEEQEAGFRRFQAPEAKKHPPSALKKSSSLCSPRSGSKGNDGHVSFSNAYQGECVDNDNDMDEDMRMAIALSLQDTGTSHDTGVSFGVDVETRTESVSDFSEGSLNGIGVEGDDRKPSAFNKGAKQSIASELDEDERKQPATKKPADNLTGDSATANKKSSPFPESAGVQTFAVASLPIASVYSSSPNEVCVNLAQSLHEADLAEYYAIQSAQAVAEEASLQLALKLQQEEDARAAQFKREEMCGNGASIGVRTVGKDEFKMMQHLKIDKLYRSVDGRIVDRRKAEEKGMGKFLANKQHDDVEGVEGLDGALPQDDDCVSYYYYREDQHHSEDYDMHVNEYDDDDGGIRMNPQKSTGENWTRLDKHTFMGPNNEIKTKHDPEVQHRSNAVKLLGSHGAKLKDAYNSAPLSDRAYNAFRRAEDKQSGMKKGVAKQGHGRAENMNAGKTRGGAMDGSVRLEITAAINSGLINKCNGVVKEGKEALVYHAEGGWRGRDGGASIVDGSHSIPHVEFPASDGYDVAVKVFKRISEFKGRGAYVDGDPRYHKQKFKTNDQREQVVMWAEKEYRNLIRADRAGVSVPKPLMCRENILFMRFCGDDGWPSPQLKEIEIKKGSDRWTTLYCQSILAIRKLYHCARLIHADLSEYNLLICPSWQISKDRFKPPKERSSEDESLQVVMIDFGQAVERGHPAAKELLQRDLSTMRDFFVRQGIKVLSNELAEDFVLAPIQDIESNLEQTTEKEKCYNNNIDDQGSIWRHAVPGWNDEKDMELLLKKLMTL